MAESAASSSSSSVSASTSADGSTAVVGIDGGAKNVKAKICSTSLPSTCGGSLSDSSFVLSTPVKPGSSKSAGGSSKPAPAHVQEFSIRVPKGQKKVHHVMRFNATLNVDFAQWRGVKLERENSHRGLKSNEEEMPKFGAGSEFNRDFREDLRRKKYGVNPRKYRADAQPWILKVGGKINKKFKGIREGGVSQNAAFYVFTHAADGSIEAYPLNEWYNFQPIQRYKALSAEEAEQEFSRRKKVMNYFSLMLRKRLKGDEEEELEPEEAKVMSKVTKKGNDLKISEMDEWIDSEDESNSDSGDDDNEDGKKKKKKTDDSDDEDKNKRKKKQSAETKKKKRNMDDEAFEESDDGDEEGREMDYDTESSEDEPDLESKVSKAMKSVAEEDALRKLLTSDEDEDEEGDGGKSAEHSEVEEGGKKEKQKDELSGKEKKKNKKSVDKKESSSEFCSSSSDTDIDVKDTKKILKPISNASSSSNKSTTMVAANSHSSSSPIHGHGGSESQKRKANHHNRSSEQISPENNNNSSNTIPTTPAKKVKLLTQDKPKASPPPPTPSSAATTISSSAATTTYSSTFTAGLNKDEFGVTEEAVRRYLMRKPMTATELLTKFKNKKTGVSSERLVETMTQILKKINPVKQTIQGKMYLSIKVK